MVEKINNMLPRIFFIVAFIIFFFAASGWLIEQFGWRYSFLPYSSGRLLEFAALLLVFVITFLLRQIRDNQK